MRRFRIIKLLIACLAVYVFILGWRINGDVLIEKKNPTSLATIRVRVLQPNPASIGSLIGLNDKIYRFEYYSKDFPMFSCQSYTGETFSASPINVEWKDSSIAVVVLDEWVKFECREGVWRRLTQEMNSVPND